MATVYTLGESLLDIIIDSSNMVVVKAGGSMLNSAVSLARSGNNVSHISEYSNDEVGRYINDFLVSNNVNTKYINRYPDGKSALAVAFLDENKDAKYSFYKQYPEKRLEISIPDFNSDDILLFGSFYSLQNEIRNRIIQIVEAAKNKNCLIIYDPNIRNPHKKDIPALIKRVEENLSFSNIVRASDQDFKNIFDIDDVEQAWELCKNFEVQHLIYTMNENGVYHYAKDHGHFYPTKKIQVISTIGAGDSFNAGLINGIIKSGRKIHWDKSIQLGIDFATIVCMSYDNYIPKDE
ncbi:carbohydrate kinase [Bacteroidota bacterium]